MGIHTPTDAEDVRIRNLCGDVDTTYAYDTNGKLSRLLMKTTNGVVTKYVYGLGLIGEQTGNSFKYYHFDSRGSTVALTGGTGIVTDTFEYDTYGKVTAHTGNNEVIFGYNGRDGVVTDANGLLYMRARYYSPEMRRFVNADVIAGEISDAITLNRYAYANGNPVSFVDPFGLSAGWSNWVKVGIGALVIAAAAVVTVATAGTAAGVIAGAALVGASVSGATGAVFGYIEGGIDGAATGFMTGSVSGAVSGVVAASGSGAITAHIADTLVDIGGGLLSNAANGDKITAATVVETAVTSAVLSFVEVDLNAKNSTGFLRSKNKSDFSSGWLNKKGALHYDFELNEKTVTRESRRANQDYARKRIITAENTLKNKISDQLFDYGKEVFIGNFKGNIKESFAESPRKKTDFSGLIFLSTR